MVREYLKGNCIADIVEKEVRIVPDYNPLDDMLTAQIKGAIDSDGYEDEMYYSRPSRNRDAAGRSTTGSRRGNERRSTGVARNNTRNRSRQMNEDERRRRNRERARQKALRKKKKKQVHCFLHCPCYLS